MVDINKPIIKYAIVGALGVLVNSAFLYALTEWCGIFYLFSAAIASELSIINNFLLNDEWTFEATTKAHSKLKRFITYQIISVIGTVILIGVMFILTESLGVYYIFANWGGVGVVFIINYLLNKHITWKS